MFSCNTTKHYSYNVLFQSRGRGLCISPISIRGIGHEKFSKLFQEEICSLTVSFIPIYIYIYMNSHVHYLHHEQRMNYFLMLVLKAHQDIDTRRWQQTQVFQKVRWESETLSLVKFHKECFNLTFEPFNLRLIAVCIKFIAF